MKNFALFLAFAAIVFASCKDKNVYTVNGNFNDTTYDGKMVFLQTIANPVDTASKSQIIDSAKIEHGKFVLEGVAKEKPEMQIVSVGKINEITNSNLEEPMMIKFISEPGTIAMDVNKESVSVTGTPKNNEYNIVNKISNELLNIHQEVQSGKMSQLEGQQKLEVKMTEVRDSIYSFTKRNMTNAVGETIFASSLGNFENDEIIELVELSNDSFKNHILVVRLLEGIEAIKRLENAIVDGTLKGTDMQATQVPLSQYAGKGNVVLLYFWSSTSQNSIQETKNLLDICKEYNGKNLQLLGVSIDTDKTAWANALKKNNLPLPQLLDTDGSIAGGFGLQTVPATILLDKTGKMRQPNLKGLELSFALDGLLE